MEKKLILDGNKIISQLQAGGAIAKRLTHYENRQEQLDLMSLIIKGFNENAHVASEAGTGVGKSFAYLLPAISFAIAAEERIVVSTATITLQQQLFEKDIPLVLSALGNGKMGSGEKIKAVLIKGRENYLCRRRFCDALDERQMSLEEAEDNALAALSAWIKTTKSGSRSELDFVPPGHVWQRVCSESDSCMGISCTFRDTCFVMTLRKEASAAKILVVNHHLLFADLAARSAGAGYEGSVVLPPYTRVIIDEAHNIEKNATSFFTDSLSRYGLLRNLGRLYRERGTAKGGSLVRLCQRLPIVEGVDKNESLGGAAQKIIKAVDELNKSALELCGTTSVFRFVNGRSNIIEEHIGCPLEKLRITILKFCHLGEEVLEKIMEQDKNLAANERHGGLSCEDEMTYEVRSGIKRLINTSVLCDSLLKWQDRPNDVVWIERRRGKNNAEDFAIINCAPVSIAEALTGALFNTNKTVICVSATLTINGSFDFWCKRTGINDSIDVEKDGEKKQLLFAAFPSPFPYETSVLTACVRGAPAPTENDYQAFLQEAVLRLSETSGGSALVLFTAFESLRNTFAYCAPALENIGLRCLKQGDDDKNRLLNEFLNDQSSILFATDSFWEGVDAPGDTLRMLIICRLPFLTPNDPLFEARCELIEKKGGNSFMELSVPISVMKFRQGFGRLIRRSSDRGVVAVLDSRILTKMYGQTFLHSIPKTKTCFADLPAILREAERILF